MTLIEVRGRGGQLIERFRTREHAIRIGRAFDNDLILEDEYVSEHHLRLTRAAEGWTLQDLDSLNGVRLVRGGDADGTLRSGAEVRIGQTRLHVFDSDHPPTPTLELSSTEEQVARLGEVRVWVPLALLLGATSLLMAYWGSVQEFEPEVLIAPISLEWLMTAGFASIWALVGRLLRHRAYFFAHFSLWTLLGIVGVATEFLAQWAGYNLNSEMTEELLWQLFSLLSLSAVTWASLALASPIHTRARLYAAAGVSLVLLALGEATDLEWDFGFSGHPDYYGRVMSPSLLVASPEAEQSLIDSLPDLFERAAEAAEEEQD